MKKLLSSIVFITMLITTNALSMDEISILPNGTDETCLYKNNEAWYHWDTTLQKTTKISEADVESARYFKLKKYNIDMDPKCYEEQRPNHTPAVSNTSQRAPSPAVDGKQSTDQSSYAAVYVVGAMLIITASAYLYYKVSKKEEETEEIN